MTLTTAVTEELGGRVARVLLTGSLDSNTAPELDVELSRRIRPGLGVLVLDMKGLSYISSAGLRVVFKAAKALKSAGGKLAIANRQPQIVKVFDIVQALPDLTVFSSDAEMDDYLRAMQERVQRGDA